MGCCSSGEERADTAVKRPHLGFVHAGNLGSSLAVAAARVGHRVTAVSRRSPDAAAELAARIGGDVLATADAQRVADACDVLFLTTVDDHIPELARQLRFSETQIVVHCSGATPLSALDAAREAGAAVAGFHPLQTFPDTRGEDRFTGVTFGIEAADPEVLAWLKRLAADLGGTTVTLDPASRALYHASAVMAGPLVAGLAGLAAGLWAGLGRDRTHGQSALAPLLTATTEQVVGRGLPAALTGPFARGDVDPVRAHVRALRAFDPAAARAYAALALAQLPLAAERGNIPDERLHELQRLLRDVVDRDDP